MATAPAPRIINPWIVAVAVMLSTFMEVLDTTVVNVSLPHIAGDMSATTDEATWVLTSYLVANAIILPMTGWLATYLGRKRLLQSAVIGFTAASFFCGLAPNLTSLIIFRVIQGATGGALQPLSQAVLLETFPPHERGKAMGFWGLGIVVAPIFGPVFGGWLTDSYSWRWVFYINIPVGIASVVMTQLFVFDPSYMKRQSERIDYWGIGMLVVGIGALQIMLDKGQEDDWFSSRFIVTLTVIAIATLTAFAIRELRVEHPVVDLRVFKERTYSTGVFLMTVLGFVLYGSLVLLPLMLQTLLGYPAVQAGITMAPRGIGSFIAMPIVGQLVSRFDPRKLVAIGLLSGGLTLLWLGSLNLNAGYWDIFWPQLIQGMGLGLIFVPLTTITMARISRERMGYATSLFSLTRNIGASIGIAVTAALLVQYRQTNINVLGAHVNNFNPAARALLQGARAQAMAELGDPAAATYRAVNAAFGLVQREAAMLAFIQVFRLLGIIFLALLPTLFLMRRPPSNKVE